MPLHKDELYNKILELKKALGPEGPELKFDDEDFRDYLVMAEVFSKGVKKGKISIYYKPSKNTFSLKKQISDKETEKAVDAVWDMLNGCETYDAESGVYEAFVDGSYISGVTGYGAVIYLGDERKAELSGNILDVEFRQFGGELQSVIEVLKWCASNGVSKIRVNYDYQGIEKFASGEWKPKNNLSKFYVDFVKNAGVDTEWRHIKSHTGNAKNDEADALAKKAALSASSTTSKRFIDLENKALAFMEFINGKNNFFAQYLGAADGEFVKVKVTNKDTRESGIADLIYAKTNNITIRQQKSGLETDIYNLWQNFLLLDDFNI